MKLPISVIMPTYNCVDKISYHLKHSQDWLNHINELIIVDSQSNDGSWELLNSNLQKFSPKYLRTKPGLFSSWNQAVSLATQPYIYYSTIRDVINLRGLKVLFQLIEQCDLDLVISTPILTNEQGLRSTDLWPIHKIKNILPEDGSPWIPTFQERQLLACSFFPGSVIGSSASNIFRTSILRQYPFPENVGSVGDVLWGIANLPKTKVGITRDELASFCYDGNRSGSWKALHNSVLMMNDYIAEQLLSEEGTFISEISYYNNQFLIHSLENLARYEELTSSPLKTGIFQKISIFIKNIYTECR
jgi:glycosyltransferase involved in cell wall biosynthesis